ncbi:MAG: AIR synthase-related protein, partial [Pseudomonadota bacterium]
REHVLCLANELLANNLTQKIQGWSAAEYQEVPVDLTVPLAGDLRPTGVEIIELPHSDEELISLSQTRSLALNLAELRTISKYFVSRAVQESRKAAGLSLDPTDVELEILAQTWSEHCKHKIFNALIHYENENGCKEEIDSLFKTYVVGATKEVSKKIPWLVSVFDDNAGVVRMDADTHLVYKVETHNSPSALDPYGGAMTGIVGVNRDPFGTGVGAELLTNVWGYCLASPFFDGQVPEGLMHPRRIRDGVHKGVIEGGNQSGIPYSRGFEIFDQRFLGKPLVFCGTVGIMPARVAGKPSESKQIQPGDLVVMVGGRIGKDGIHGATFSSEALHRGSPAHAVQIGDPITQRMMTDMLLEARDQGLYRTLTDNGAGGLSSSVGELARLSNGAELELEKAPLKYPGLQPWEILLSEAQERMTLAVPPQHEKALLELARKREVEATVIGRFTNSGRFRVKHQGELVADLDLEFMHSGCPQMDLEARWISPRVVNLADMGIKPDEMNLAGLLEDIVQSINLCSKETKCRQYDHEVKGLSVIKPLVGVHCDVPSDATAIRVQHGRPEAILLSEGIAPRISSFDPGAMAAYVVDLAVRRIVACGGKLDFIAGLDNFCWPDPVQSAETPDGRRKLAGLVRACKELHALTCSLNVPLISGKDSMKNDSTRGGVKISIPPTLLFSTIGWIPDASMAIDLTIGQPGDVIYVVGQTRPELGGSELLARLAEIHDRPEWIGICDGIPEGPPIPSSSPTVCRQNCEAVQRAIEAQLVTAAHAPHLGGLGMGFTTMALAADLGVEVNIDAVPISKKMNDVELLFSECSSRFLLAASEEETTNLEKLLDAHGVPWGRVGCAKDEKELVIRDKGKILIQLPLAVLKQAFSKTLRNV